MGTREMSNWIAHVDTFVDPDGSEAKQAASCAAIGKLLLDNRITIQDIVTAIGKYLTATDNSIRARGLLLLGELLVKLATIPLENTTIHSLTTFFTARLADWHCLRGALMGSIALLRRPREVGSVEESDAKDMAKSVLQNLHVQALGLTDRLLSLELFECLLHIHGASVSSMGGDLVYGVSAAIEEEKDPRCLLVAFHLVELLAGLFPEAGGPLADSAEEIFDIVSRYFPVSFTPPPNDTRGISREDLADALLKVFTSTPLFAPFCIPMLLEKLTASLQRAKLDSLRYLGLCALSFGPTSIAEHLDAIWLALKTELIPKADDQKDVQVHDAALICLTRCVEASQKGAEEIESGVTVDLLKLICADDCVEDLLRFVEKYATRESQYETILDVSVLQPESDMLSKRANEQTRATGEMLAAVVRASDSSCHFVTDKILNRITMAGGMTCLRQSGTPPDSTVVTEKSPSLRKGSLSVLGLEVTIQILQAASEVAERIALLSTSSTSMSTKPITKMWLEPVCALSPQLFTVFSQVTSGQVLTANQSMLGVAGLQALASFPAGYSPLTEEELRNTLSIFVEILLDGTNSSALKDSALDAILTTSALEEKLRPLYENIDFTVVAVVSPKLLEAVQQAETTATLRSPLQALAAVASTGQISRQAVLIGLRHIIAAKFMELGAADDNASQRMVAILECLSQEIIPFCVKGSTEQMTACDVVLDIWAACQNLSHTTKQISDEVLSSLMAVNRVTIRSCLEVTQEQILSMATSVLLDMDISNTCVNTSIKQDATQDLTLYTTGKSTGDRGIAPISNSLVNTSLKQDEMQDWIVYTTTEFTGERGWLVALVASVVLGLLPAVVFRKRHLLLKIFVNAAISEGSSLKTSVAAQATASLFNKWKDTLRGNERTEGKFDTLDGSIGEAVDEILMPVISQHLRDHESTANVWDGSVHKELDEGKVVGAVYALAWIGKGLAMRGHSRVSDVAAALLAVLQSEGTKVVTTDAAVQREDASNLGSGVAEAAAESIGLIVKDNATCLDSVHNAVVRPLFKQRFFTSMLPPLHEAVRIAGTSFYRIWFFRAFGHLLSGTPRTAVLTEGQKVFPLVLEGLSALCSYPEDSDVLLSTLLTLSSFLTDENHGRTIAADNIPAMVKRLTSLVHYGTSLVIRETALQCLGAIVGLPFTRIFPEKPQVMKAILAALDDPKRRVRKEAVRCRRVWSAISS